MVTRIALRVGPAGSPVREEVYVVEPFGDNPNLADELVALIVSGKKTATCTALWEFEAEGIPVSRVGLKNIVLSGAGEPLCIIETIEVTLRAYQGVDAQFAHEEGEGDQSLEEWREGHWRYFSRTLAKIGKVPTLNMPLVCERFKVIYKP